MGGRGASSGASYSPIRRTQTEHEGKWKKPPSLGEQLASANGISVSEGEAQAQALYKYSGQEYRDIRDAYYNGLTDSPAYQKAVAIENFIKQSPNWNGGELYRGVHLPSASLKHLKEGGRIDMKGMSSWTSDPKIAQNFAKANMKGESSVLFKVSGTKQGASVTHLSRFGKKEGEVLISGKATWTIKSITKKGGTTIVEVEED